LADEAVELPAIAARVELAGGPTDLITDRASRVGADDAAGRFSDRLDGLVSAALVAEQAGNRKDALVHLAEAFRLAAPTGWLAPFVEAGEPVRDLASKLPADVDAASARLRRDVLNAFGGHVAATAASQPLLVEALTERELAVLRRLPSSLSNQEIASLLFVSLNTVKTQIKSVYRKLGVSSRHEAIERARHLGLL
jgi:LuxR family maltose regulon positive regulatory protein